MQTYGKPAAPEYINKQIKLYRIWYGKLIPEAALSLKQICTSNKIYSPIS